MNIDTKPQMRSEESLDKVRDLVNALLHPTPTFTQLMANLKANHELDATASTEKPKEQLPATTEVRASTKTPITPRPDSSTKTSSNPPSEATTLQMNERALQALLALVVDYANGLTQMELAQKHDMHVQTVRKRLKEVGVNLRARVKLLSPAQLEAARSSIACGASLRATARQLGVSHATLTRNLKPGKV